MPDGFFYDEQFVALAAGSGYSRRLGDAILEVREQLGADTIDNVLVTVSTHRVMLIPAPEAYRAEYMLGLTFTGVEGEEVVLTQNINNCVLVYGLSKDVHQFFARTFDVVEYQHPMASLIEQTMQCAQQQEITRKQDRHADMFIMCDMHFTDVCVAQDGQLMMATRFVANNYDDRLYYIMNAWKQLRLDQLSDHIRLVSLNPESKTLLLLLSKYVKNTGQ